MRVFSMVSLGLIAVLDIVRGLKQFYAISDLGFLRAFILFLVIHTGFSLAFGIFCAVLLLKQWRDNRNFSTSLLSVLFIVGFFLAGWTPIFSFSAAFQAQPGVWTAIADFLSRFTAPESVLLIALTVRTLLSRDEKRHATVHGPSCE